MKKSSTHLLSCIFVFGEIFKEAILYAFGDLFAARLVFEIFSVIFLSGETLVW
jgi:hypothetical protein